MTNNCADDGRICFNTISDSYMRTHCEACMVNMFTAWSDVPSIGNSDKLYLNWDGVCIELTYPVHSYNTLHNYVVIVLMLCNYKHIFQAPLVHTCIHESVCHV